MSKIALTDVTIKSLPLPNKGQKTYFDKKQPNFGIRVSQGGSKSFVVLKKGTRSYHTIGKHPAVSLKIARREAQIFSLRQSSYPLERPALSHSEAKFLFIDDKRGQRKSRTVADYQRLLDRHFDFGSKPLTAVRKTDIVSRLDRLKKTPSERHHAFVAARAFYNWCVSQGHLEIAPTDRMAPTLPTASRDRILSDQELAAVYLKAQTFTKPFGTLVQLLILTGLRRSEVTNLHRTWIVDGVLTIPGEHTKNGYAHSLPMPKMALELLEPLPDQFFLSDSGVIFSNWGNSKKRFDQELDVEHYRIHDLRRTFASVHARLGTQIHVVEKMLNHVSGRLSGVAGIYNRYDYIDEMREALINYENHIKSILD